MSWPSWRWRSERERSWRRRRHAFKRLLSVSGRSLVSFITSTEVSTQSFQIVHEWLSVVTAATSALAAPGVAVSLWRGRLWAEDGDTYNW